MGQPQAVAEWTLDERDVAAEMNARSGSTLDLVRTETNVGAKGILLGTRTGSYFIPRRALGANEEAFKAIAAGVRPRPLPRGTWFTVGVWLFAVFVGAAAYYD